MALLIGVLAAILLPHIEPVIARCDNERLKDLKLLPNTIQNRQPSAQKQTCTLDIFPVCGTDKKTYRNYCYLNNQSWENQWRGLSPIYIDSYGACPVEGCTCPFNFDPICASDGKIIYEYSNYCTFECQRRRREQLGEPPLKIVPCKESCGCTKQYEPVCGTDGITYNNPCLLDCASKRLNKTIKIDHKGECGCFCTPVYDPVCASDGIQVITYGSSCKLACENEARKRQGLPALLQLYEGVCQPCNCPFYVQPICGTNWKTYLNQCYLGCENQRRAKVGQPPYYYWRGACPSYNCTNIYDPVCASDNKTTKTYDNQCKLDYENSRRAIQGLPPLRFRSGACSW